jgi:hypothetical protein
MISDAYATLLLGRTDLFVWMCHVFAAEIHKLRNRKCMKTKQRKEQKLIQQKNDDY